ncbi:Maf family protein [Faunimonas sp. B44]|uniref:Maf family protein n=1 Tax=Faunimonas sp. B44 TaxID=3461493 RepID=UPI00404451B5
MLLILASSSPTRARLLSEAGLMFDVRPAELDERAAEEPLRQAGAPPEDLAMALALAKAQMVSERFPGDLVIGADQTLDLDGEAFSKPHDMEAARRQLLRLSGRTHHLHAAAACARNGEIVWSHSETAELTMRPFGPVFVGRYLAAVGERALGSVGAYQIEGRGIQLFSRIDGDFFAVLGLPLLPLLEFLRHEGLVET